MKQKHAAMIYAINTITTNISVTAVVYQNVSKYDTNA